MKDRFSVELEDGDFITYIENDSDKICIAYVFKYPGEECKFSRCYSEPWGDKDELLESPSSVRGLWLTRKTYTLDELNANIWTIIALKSINPLDLNYGKVW